MFYSLYDKRMQVFEPVMESARMMRAYITHPLNPLAWTMPGRSFRAGVDVLESLTAQREKPAWNLDKISVDGISVAVKNEVIERYNFCDLRLFSIKPSVLKQEKPRLKIFIIAPLSGHFATLLRDTVRRLLNDGDVYITDWCDCKHIPLLDGSFHLDDYISLIIKAMKRISSHNGDQRGPHCLAVCQPAPLLLAASALMAQDHLYYRPRSITLMGGPVDVRANETTVTRLAENRPISWFEHNNIHHVPLRYAGAGRPVYPGFLQLRAFWSMNPARHNMAHWHLFKHLARGDEESADKTKDFYDEYMAVMDVPAEYYIETIDRIFKNHELPLGNMQWRGRKIDPSHIKDIALMSVEGALDDISAPGQTLAAHDLCPNIPKSKKHILLEEGVGHYGIFNGKKWRNRIAPKIIDMMRANDAQAKN